ncbi:unnamed protein product [Phytophthora fragariaefolia]|uniref:Unnamed protein product n=1 Tax=Phytophthora fragariaefolia TaxID=1490495 RepID=A0A9W6XJ77_9STRA|nr:unnamed protein product [Phytophthora fragariaefolia]
MHCVFALSASTRFRVAFKELSSGLLSMHVNRAHRGHDAHQEDDEQVDRATCTIECIRRIHGEFLAGGVPGANRTAPPRSWASSRSSKRWTTFGKREEEQVDQHERAVQSDICAEKSVAYHRRWNAPSATARSSARPTVQITASDGASNGGPLHWTPIGGTDREDPELRHEDV